MMMQCQLPTPEYMYAYGIKTYLSSRNLESPEHLPLNMTHLVSQYSVTN